MYITEKALIELVKTEMEELTPAWQEGVVDQTDVLGISRYIAAKIPDAIRRLYRLLPASSLNPLSGKESWECVRHQDGSGHLLLPENCMRMLSFRMKGWRRNAVHFYESSSPQAAWQNNLHLRGGVTRPVCIVGHTPEGDSALYYYSLPADIRVHEIEEALYVALPQKIEESYHLPLGLETSVAYMTAGLVYELMAKPEMALLMQNKALL